MKSSDEIRRMARNALAGRWGTAFGASAASYGITYAISLVFVTIAYIALVAVFIGASVTGGVMNPDVYGGISEGVFTGSMAFGLIVCYVMIIFGSLIASVIGSNLTLGLYSLCLKNTHGETVGFSEIFTPLKRHWWRSFALFFMMELKAFLWMSILYLPALFMVTIPVILRSEGSTHIALPIVCAIGWILLIASIVLFVIAMIRYSMAPMVFLSNPSLGVFSAIRESKRLMKGHKGEMFILELSFIGWYLLAGLASGIGMIFLNPYLYTAYCVFFNELTGQETIDRTIPVYTYGTPGYVPPNGWGDYNPNPVGQTYGQGGQNGQSNPVAPTGTPENPQTPEVSKLPEGTSSPEPVSDDGGNVGNTDNAGNADNAGNTGNAGNTDNNVGNTANDQTTPDGGKE